MIARKTEEIETVAPFSTYPKPCHDPERIP
jgi:hypothetical protein